MADVTTPAQWRAWIVASYRSALDVELCAPHDLDGHPAAVLCHDTAADPVFVYANTVAHDLWERPLVGTPSRLSAPPDMRAARASALASGDVVRGYTGIRQSASGGLFRILDATVWPVVDEHGSRRGQAAMFARWEPVG